MVAAGDRVRYGFRTGRVLRLERRGGLDGAVVASDVEHQADGSLPHWIPLSGVNKIPEPT